MWRQSRIESFALSFKYCWMWICLQLINKTISLMPHIIHIVLVMNSTESVIFNGNIMFTLDDQWMATMIAEKRKGNFDTYFFVIDNFIKHANAKGYNRHVATGAMQLSELLSVGQEALGLLLLENYWEPWKQLVEYMKQGESELPSNVEPSKTKYTNPGQKKMPWKSEGMEQYNQPHEEVCQDQISSEGQRFEIEFKKKMKQEAGVAWSRKRKTIQSVNLAAVHELDNVSSDEDTSQQSQQTGSTYGSSISSQVSNPTGV